MLNTDCVTRRCEGNARSVYYCVACQCTFIVIYVSMFSLRLFQSDVADISSAASSSTNWSAMVCANPPKFPPSDGLDYDVYRCVERDIVLDTAATLRQHRTGSKHRRRALQLQNPDDVADENY